MAKNQTIYRGIAVVNTNDTGEILFDFIKEQQYKFCLYDNGGDTTGLDCDSPLTEKFYLSEPLIPKDFFPSEYWTMHHKLNKSILRLWRYETYRLAECNEEFYTFLKMGLGMNMYISAFFKSFVPYTEIFRHMSFGVFDYTLADLCELVIEIQGPDSWAFNSLSNNRGLLAALETQFAEKNIQTCKCMMSDNYHDVEYELKYLHEKISKCSPPVPNKKFDWDHYNAKET